MIDIKSMWLAAPPPAPETASLKRLRMWSMALCLGAAASIAGIDVIVGVSRYAVLPVAALTFAAALVTGIYWRVKKRVDDAHADRLSEQRLEEERGREGE